MANNFFGIIAQQTVPFRGTSQISVRAAAPDMPHFRALKQARYLCSVTGGVSGSFGVLVLADVGGLTWTIAGNTTVGTGLNVLYPTTWGNDGVVNALETATGAATQQIIDSLPPAYVAFQSAIATAGISATITVSAAIQGAY
jgi:hypothetical protein